MSKNSKNTKATSNKPKSAQLKKAPKHVTIHKKNGYISFLKILYVLTSFSLSLVGGYALLAPQLIISPYMPPHVNYPFETYLTIINNSLSEITDVDCTLDNVSHTVNDIKQHPAILYTHDPNGKLIGIKTIRINKIKAKHKEHIELNKMFGLISNRADSASFSITIKFSVWYLPFRLSESYNYKLSKIVTGDNSWIETTN